MSPTASPSPHAATARGFTLVEVLVVMLLIALLSSFAVLSLPRAGPAEQQRTEALRLLGRLELAREEAVLQGRSVGLRTASDGYRFMQLTADGWRAFAGDHALRPHRLPVSLRLMLDLDGVAVDLGVETDATDAGGEHAPQLYFLAGGEVLPGFTIRLVTDDSATEYRIAPGDERWFELIES